MNADRDLRDPALDAAWRTHSSESPPAHLDAAILAEAHRAVGSVPRATGGGAAATRPWRRWMPLAAAATIGAVAFGVLQMSPSERDATTAIVSDMPAPAETQLDTLAARKDAPPAEGPANAPSAQVPAAPPALVPRRNAAEQKPRFTPEPAPSRPREVPPSSSIAAAPSAPPPAPAQPKPLPRTFAPSMPPSVAGEPESNRDLEESKREERTVARSNAGVADERMAAQQPAKAATAVGKLAVGDDARAARDPAEWIANIRARHAAGNLQDAARELTAFRAAYRDADMRLPEDLRAWAATVKP
jgi:hypothetical protein